MSWSSGSNPCSRRERRGEPFVLSPEPEVSNQRPAKGGVLLFSLFCPIFLAIICTEGGLAQEKVATCGKGPNYLQPVKPKKPHNSKRAVAFPMGLNGDFRPAKCPLDTLWSRHRIEEPTRSLQFSVLLLFLRIGPLTGCSASRGVEPHRKSPRMRSGSHLPWRSFQLSSSSPARGERRRADSSAPPQLTCCRRLHLGLLHPAYAKRLTSTQPCYSRLDNSNAKLHCTVHTVGASLIFAMERLCFPYDRFVRSKKCEVQYLYRKGNFHSNLIFGRSYQNLRSNRDHCIQF